MPHFLVYVELDRKEIVMNRLGHLSLEDFFEFIDQGGGSYR